jgi:hypothetical protein
MAHLSESYGQFDDGGLCLGPRSPMQQVAHLESMPGASVPTSML